jgi:hypothetical protein
VDQLDQPHIPVTTANNMVSIPPLTFLALQTIGSQSFIGHLRGDSCWKLLFREPDNIQGLRANYRVLSVGQILSLSDMYPLHDTLRFIATFTRDIEGLALYHVEENVEGVTPKELLASLEWKNLLGARTSSSDEAVGPAIWWSGTDDDILVMA